MHRFALHSTTFLLILLAVALARPASAQNATDAAVVPAPDPRPSPLSLARATLGDGTYVKVHYSAPLKRGRTIFGELVPYGQLWRTGANEAAEITFTQPVLFGGRPLPAGTYSLFTIPRRDGWTVILNLTLGQNGAADYDPQMDLLRVEAPAEANRQTYEAFTILFEDAADGKDLVFVWDRTRVAVPIRPL